MILKKASDIECASMHATSHEEFVAEDAGRIFRRMVIECQDQIPEPDLFVMYSPRDLERLPPCPGVYIAFCERGRCQYVGESACVGRRIGNIGTRDELHYAKYIAVVLADSERQMRAMEMYYIGLFDPVFNKQLHPRGKRVTAYINDIVWDESKRLWAIRGGSGFLDRKGVLREHRLSLTRTQVS